MALLTKNALGSRRFIKEHCTFKVWCKNSCKCNYVVPLQLNPIPDYRNAVFKWTSPPANSNVLTGYFYLFCEQDSTGFKMLQQVPLDEKLSAGLLQRFRTVLWKHGREEGLEWLEMDYSETTSTWEITIPLFLLAMLVNFYKRE